MLVRNMTLLRAATALLPLLLPVTACGDDAPRRSDAAGGDTALGDTGADAAADAVAADTAQADTSATLCSPSDRAACLYRPSATYPFTTTRVDGLTYTDVTGATRNVNVAVYRPTGAPTPMPVVLLSHGGADGKTNPLQSMEHWAPVFAAAGYLAVAIAHEGRDDASYEALCAALEVSTANPCGLKIGWDRPHDVDRVLTWLAEQAVTPPLAGQIDLDRIAHVGHSAGAGAAMMSVGATRNYVCGLPFGFESDTQDCQVADLVSLAKPEIDVAVALSPQGPGSDGFMEESYATVTRPMLMATGANDGDEGEPASRVALWPLLAAGDKHKVYIDDPGAKHTLFEGDTQACVPLASENKCAAMRDSVFSAALAFVDAHLRASAAAAAWLASDQLETAGGGIIDLEHR